MKTIAYFGELMRLAKALGDAKKSGDKEKIEKAQAAHDAYHSICLKADEMVITGITRGDL
jgi:hypothetical protein